MKKSYLFLLLSLITTLYANDLYAQCAGIDLQSLTNPGPYTVATLTEADGVRNGPDYNGATIYYPTNSTASTFASIAIVPGFVSQPSSVQDWGPFYASHGIVAMIIGTNSLFDFEEARATALLDALETLRQENTRASSPLAAALNLDQMAVSGWSMGGGGAQRAAVRDNSIAGVVAMCPYLNNAQLNHSVPVLIFSGEVDTVAPPSQHADIHYNTTPDTTDKVLFEIGSGDHSVANSPTGGNGSVGKIALSWLKLYVEENDCYCTLLTDDLLLNPVVASKIEQDFECTTLGTQGQNMDFVLYPNPTRNKVYLEIPQDVHYELHSPLGQLLLKGDLSGTHKQIDLTQLPASMYYLNIEGQITKVIKYD
jgi:dienelactone hydrolase